jgi:hypothetical protein
MIGRDASAVKPASSSSGLIIHSGTPQADSKKIPMSTGKTAANLGHKIPFENIVAIVSFCNACVNINPKPHIKSS